jgi:hypothetical protein
MLNVITTAKANMASVGKIADEMERIWKEAVAT